MARLVSLIVFLGFPIAEIAVFIMVGSAIGVLPTIALIILSAVLGLTLLRNRGLSALSRVRADLENDRVPADALAEAMSVAIAGILLIIPGFITDTIGLLLLLPGVRRGLGRKMSRSTTFVDATFVRGGRGRGGRTVDLGDDEFHRADEPSPWQSPGAPPEIENKRR